MQLKVAFIVNTTCFRPPSDAAAKEAALTVSSPRQSKDFRRVPPWGRDDSLMPVTVEGMNKAMAWETANLGPRARRLAEDAAHRAGMSPEEWLNEAIVEYAASVRSKETSEEVQFHERRRETISGRGERVAGPGGHPQDQQVPEVQDLLESTVQQIERRITSNGQRLAEAFEAVALRLERSNASLERLAFAEEQPQSDAVEMPQTNEGPRPCNGAAPPPLPFPPRRSTPIRALLAK